MQITWELILAIAGGIVVLINAIKAIINCLNPIKHYKSKVDKHDALLDNDNKRLTSLENSNNMICKSMLAMLDHFITGNNIEKLKQTKKEMQEYLIDNK